MFHRQRIGILRSFALAVLAGLLWTAQARSQYPYAYGGFGYGGFGYGSSGFGGYPGFGPGYGYGYGGIGGFGYGPGFYPGYASGFVYPGFAARGFGYGPFGPVTPYTFETYAGASYQALATGRAYPNPFNPFSVAFYNPYFAAGLSPLALQSAVAEQILSGRPAARAPEPRPGDPAPIIQIPRPRSPRDPRPDPR